MTAFMFMNSRALILFLDECTKNPYLRTPRRWDELNRPIKFSY